MNNCQDLLESNHLRVWDGVICSPASISDSLYAAWASWVLHWGCSSPKLFRLPWWD